MFQSLLASVVVISLSLSLVACGKKKEDDTPNEVKSLLGTWMGTMSVRESETTKKTRANVSMEFERAGKYSIVDVDLKQTAKGNYIVFEKEKQVDIIVNESDFNSFGLKADMIEYRYEISDERLSLKAENATLILSKELDENSGEAHGKIIHGLWQGSDSYGHAWRVNIADDGNAEVWVQADGESYMRGPHTIDPLEGDNSERLGEIVITEMKPKKTLQSLDLAFRFGESPHRLEVVTVDLKGQRGEAVSCYRKK